MTTTTGNISKSSTPATPAAASTPRLSNESFVHLWAGFRSQSERVIAERKGNDATHTTQSRPPNTSQQAPIKHHRQKILGLLEAMTKLMFGIDETKKSIAVSMGSMELIMNLLDSAGAMSAGSDTDKDLDDTDVPLEKLWMSGLKAIKCSVIRNKQGRARCRSAGVFSFVSYILQESLKTTSPDNEIASLSIVEEGMTTLSAVCLGDDLNALQASVQLRHHVEEASSKYTEERFASMQQKVRYLSALFDAIQTEQKELLLDDDWNDGKDFFKELVKAEQELQSATKRMSDDATTDDAVWNQAEEDCTSALNRIEPWTKHTHLLDTLVCSLRTQRATVRLQHPTGRDYDGVLEDANAALEYELPPETTARIHTMRADAYQGMNQTEEAREALGKANVVCPQDESIQARLESLELSKEKKESQRDP